MGVDTTNLASGKLKKRRNTIAWQHLGGTLGFFQTHQPKSPSTKRSAVEARQRVQKTDTTTTKKIPHQKVLGERIVGDCAGVREGDRAGDNERQAAERIVLDSASF